MPEANQLDIDITYLQMIRPAEVPTPASPLPDVRVMTCRRPTISFYRYLYNTVGDPWLWVSRRTTPDDELRAILDDDNTRIDVLYVEGVPAGFAEIDLGQHPDVELLFFGLIPEYIGRKLGPFFLTHMIRTVWTLDPPVTRFWLHTCNLDHPRALDVYRRAGFEIFDRRTKRIDDPRASGLL